MVCVDDAILVDVHPQIEGNYTFPLNGASVRSVDVHPQIEGNYTSSGRRPRQRLVDVHPQIEGMKRVFSA